MKCNKYNQNPTLAGSDEALNSKSRALKKMPTGKSVQRRHSRNRGCGPPARTEVSVALLRERACGSHYPPSWSTCRARRGKPCVNLHTCEVHGGGSVRRSASRRWVVGCWMPLLFAATNLRLTATRHHLGDSKRTIPHAQQGERWLPNSKILPPKTPSCAPTVGCGERTRKRSPEMELP